MAHDDGKTVEKQLEKLNGEIDAVTADIKTEKGKWEKALEEGKDKLADGLQKSIGKLEDEKKTLLAQRHELAQKLSFGAPQGARRGVGAWRRRAWGM